MELNGVDILAIDARGFFSTGFVVTGRSLFICYWDLESDSKSSSSYRSELSSIFFNLDCAAGTGLAPILPLPLADTSSKPSLE